MQRLQKTLEDANIKIASVVSDITGTSGRAMLRALIEGETDPERLLALTTGRLRADRKTLKEALRGRIRAPHHFRLKLHLEQVETLEKAVDSVDTEVGAVLEPFRAKVARLVTMPGISDVAAQVLVSEIGVDMGRFPTAGHLVSWAGLCPRNDESAGKRRSTRLRQGAPWLKATLTQAAWSAARAKSGYLRAQFLRLKSRRGPKKAIMAVAASMLTAAYYMLRDDVDYRDLGTDYFDRLDRTHVADRLVRRLRNPRVPGRGLASLRNVFPSRSTYITRPELRADVPRARRARPLALPRPPRAPRQAGPGGRSRRASSDRDGGPPSRAIGRGPSPRGGANVPRGTRSVGRRGAASGDEPREARTVGAYARDPPFPGPRSHVAVRAGLFHVERRPLRSARCQRRGAECASAKEGDPPPSGSVREGLSLERTPSPPRADRALACARGPR